MPQDNDDDWGLDGPDYDHTNYECMECGVFDDDITDDLCIVCFEAQEAETTTTEKKQ